MTYGAQAGRSGGRRALPLVLAAAVGLVLVLVVRAVVSGGDDQGGDPPRADGSGERTDCQSLRVTASSEKAALLSQVAADYNRSDRRVDGACVDVQVSSKASGGATEALARGWNERVDGPRPDVWSPASSSWTALLRQRTAAQDKGDLVPDETPSIAQTPLVIAMPQPMAEALGWPAKPLGWGDVLSLARDPRGWGGKGRPEWGAFKLGKTNPDFSTSGLHATIAAYFAATQRSSDLTGRDVADPKVTAYVRGLESSVVHYGDTTLTFLENLYAAAEAGRPLTYISAVTVEEKSVWDYNQGNPSGDPATLGKRGKPRVPLVAVYPKEGTLLSDNPYVVLAAEWVDGRKQAAAADFLAFVREPAQQQRFTDAAFRSADGKPGGPITRANGLLPETRLSLIDPPAPAVLDQVAKSWTTLRKRARVLMVIDVSGSMSGTVPGGGGTKLDLAKKAALGAVGKLAADDELGLWTFSTPPADGATPWQELVPTGPVRSVLPTFRSKVEALVPEGGTALYATTRAAVQQVEKSFDRTRINAVVLLTDGKNEYPPDNNLDGLLTDLGGEQTDTSVRVFPIAYGDAADLGVLREIAKASRAAAYDATDPATIERVLVAVLSNF
ncbi:MAG TPA: substrate-binding and VWA domain-containing protein [Mycobacteriales bacterium]|nr:substrate-binding and VWA domain-containing protein [Mycobacteriales bacterium]